MEHFLAASWVQRASEAATGEVARGVSRGHAHGYARGYAARAASERVWLGWGEDGALVLERRCGRRRWRVVRRRAVRRVLGRWREVRGWWEDSGGCDFVLYRLLLSDGAVVDVARDLPERDWKLVGVVD